jgi:uncharacterized protein (DUF983 family)
MKRATLPAIRSRLDRLAREFGADAEATLVIHWLQPYDNCPTCGYDLDAHARDETVERARRKDGVEAGARRVLFYWWPQMLGACPHCGASLPWTAGGDR